MAATIVKCVLLQRLPKQKDITCTPRSRPFPAILTDAPRYQGLGHPLQSGIRKCLPLPLTYEFLTFSAGLRY